MPADVWCVQTLATVATLGTAMASCVAYALHMDVGQKILDSRLHIEGKVDAKFDTIQADMKAERAALERRTDNSVLITNVVAVTSLVAVVIAGGFGVFLAANSSKGGQGGQGGKSSS